MNRRVIIMLVVLLMMASSAMAFDGARKGFVLGGGLGYAPTINTTEGNFELKESGVGANILLGYAWDEANMIVYDVNIATYTKNSVDVSQGISAATWYHYWGPMGKSFFTVAGLGLYYFAIEGAGDADRKAGILLGGGYEFSKHWQVGLYLSSGKTEAGSSELEHTTVSVLIGGVAF